MYHYHDDSIYYTALMDFVYPYHSQTRIAKKMFLEFLCKDIDDNDLSFTTISYLDENKDSKYDIESCPDKIRRNKNRKR